MKNSRILFCVASLFLAFTLCAGVGKQEGSVHKSPKATAIDWSALPKEMEDLIKSGKVTQGYLGVQIGALDEELARQFDVPDTAGTLVNDVTPDGPADKAGLENGDVIRKFNGQRVEKFDQLTAMVTSTNPGTEVALDILRDGKPMTIRVTLGERPANLGAAGGRGKISDGTLGGITVEALTPSIREQLGLLPRTTGVVISEIDPNSPAAQAGLQRGDVIESISRLPVNSVAEFKYLAAQARGKVLLRVNRQGQGFFAVISPADGQGNLAAAGTRPAKIPAPPQSVSFTTVRSQDHTIAVRIPTDWMAAGTFENFKAFSPRGESFTSGRSTFMMDQGALGALNQLCSMGRYSREQCILMSRSFAPPLAPVDVIRTLYPQVAGGAIQNMRILGSRELVSQGQLGAALVHYQYTLLPHQDPAFQSTLNPALLTQNQILMEGVALIMTFPPLINSFLPAMNQWDGASWSAEAPQSLFVRNIGIYAKIFDTYQVDFMALKDVSRQEAESWKKLNDTTREIGNNFLLSAAGQAEWVGSEDRERRIMEDKACSNGTSRYICGNHIECLTRAEAAPRRDCQEAIPVR